MRDKTTKVKQRAICGRDELLLVPNSKAAPQRGPTNISKTNFVGFPTPVPIYLETMISDLELLQNYARNKSEESFAALVNRHLNLVYSAAFRQVRSPQLAEEVAQSAFTDLARNAVPLCGMKPDTILTAWLYQVARRTAIDVIRREARRQLREHIASEMNTMNTAAADWTHIEPLLDEAMEALDDTDRTAVLLRYFENKSLREVGQTLGTSDDAAQKRVSRAIERLREFFTKRNVTVGAGGLAVLISANAVQAAPVGLATTISAAATLAGTAVHTSTVILGTLKVTTWAKFKMALGFSIGILALSGVVTLALIRFSSNSESDASTKSRELSEKPNDRPINQGMKNTVNDLKLTPSNTTPVLPSTKNDDLTAANILTMVQQAYASLSSYRDTGWTAHKYGEDAWTNRFDQLLARSNCYRIEVVTAQHPYIHTNVNWSAGDGDYFQLINTDIFTNSSGLFGNMAAVSSDVTVPAVFFNLNNLSPLSDLTDGEHPLIRQQDETVSGVDCYVLTCTNSFEVAIWIGKQDFLIRRWRSFLSSEAYVASRNEFKKWTGQNPIGSKNTEPITTIETHENISVNEALTKEEFTHNPATAPVRDGQ